MGFSYNTGKEEVEIIGNSRLMQQIYRGIEIVSKTRYPVLLRGETGTGKNLVAGAIHYKNGGGPFVPVNCGAIPKTLIEGELFGYRKGAFTDARQDRKGKMEQASGGSIFLDEIGAMTVDLQPKLLRALEEGKIYPLGAEGPVDVNVRVISATNSLLEEHVGLGNFREDLFYRLNVLNLWLPPLRDRPEDIRALADYFVKKFNAKNGRNRTLWEDCYALLEKHAWPGNVRELENAIIRAALNTDDDLIRQRDFGFLGKKPVHQDREAVILTMDHLAAAGMTLEKVEKEFILAALRRYDGNTILAAKELGIGKSTLYRRLREWGIEDRPGISTMY